MMIRLSGMDSCHVPFSGLWLDFPGLGQGNFGEDGTDQLINENGEKDNIPNDGPFLTHLRCHCHRHAQSNASLGSRVMPRYLHTFSSHFITLAAAEAPAILPADRDKI